LYADRCRLAVVQRKPGVWRDAKIHLEVLGQTRELALRVRGGPARARDLLAVATEISRQVSELAVAEAVAGGAQVTCKAGCAACCRQLVPISGIEARQLAEAVDGLPPRRRREVRRRFAEAVRQMEAIGLLDPLAARGRSALRGADWDDVSRRYFAAQIPCPLLEDERCGLYADRPLVCREYLVVTPAEWCGEFSGRARAVARPVRMSEALADAGNEFAGVEFASVPLALALEWAEVHGAALAGQADGEAMFWALIGEIEGAEREGGVS
jgi:Fe-S-cluster containining protein